MFIHCAAGSRGQWDLSKEVPPRRKSPLIHCLVGFERGFGEQKAAFLCGTWPEVLRPLQWVLFIFSWVIISAVSQGHLRVQSSPGDAPFYSWMKAGMYSLLTASLAHFNVISFFKMFHRILQIPPADFCPCQVPKKPLSKVANLDGLAVSKHRWVQCCMW